MMTSYYYIVFTGLFGLTVGLECWLCIGDECEDNPKDLHNARTQECRPSEACQKVYYQVKANKGDVTYKSTTRSCSAGRCQDRNDFMNCTRDALENPGCMRRDCCEDRDHCNTATVCYSAFNKLFATICVIIPMIALSLK